MQLGLDGQVALVTGSTQGIGYAVARSLLAEGATVLVNGRSPERVEAAVRRLRGEVPDAQVSGLACDFADAAAVGRLVADLPALDVLVNNVGLFEVKDFLEVTDADWQTYLDVNLMSGVRLARAVLPGMLERGRGRVVFVSSESGVDVPADMIHYGASKAAALALANGLAKLTRGTAVTVNTVLGGPVWSDGVATAVEGIAQAQDVEVDQLRAMVIAGRTTSLVQRFLEPDEIAHLVAYLASPLSSATNGSALRADGGVLPTIL